MEQEGADVLDNVEDTGATLIVLYRTEKQLVQLACLQTSWLDDRELAPEERHTVTVERLETQDMM